MLTQRTSVVAAVCCLVSSAHCVTAEPVAELGAYEPAAPIGPIAPGPDAARGDANDAGGDELGDDAGLAVPLEAGPEEMSSPDAGPEGGSNRLEQLLAIIDGAVARWRQLERDAGARYWYEEEQCSFASTTGTVSSVQVDGDRADVVGMSTITRSAAPGCERVVDRYLPLGALSMRALYQLCTEVVNYGREQSTLEVDDAGVLRSCFFAPAPNTLPGCRDNCGRGYHLRRWSFGDAQVPLSVGDAGLR